MSIRFAPIPCLTSWHMTAEASGKGQLPMLHCSADAGGLSVQYIAWMSSLLFPSRKWSSYLQVPAFARDRVLELLQASPDVSGSSVRVLMTSEQHCPDVEKLSDVIKVFSCLDALWLPRPSCRQHCCLYAKSITC